MREVAIVAGARTPFGRAVKGSLRQTRPETLAAHALKATLAQVPQLAPEALDDLILGCALPEGEQGLNLARQVVFLAGLPVSVPAMTINRFCSSGLQAMSIAAGAIATGQADVIAAGGVESMSLVPMTSGRLALHPELSARYPEAYTPMGITAEKVARRYEVDRAAQDAFAVSSQRKAAAAWAAGRFDDEVAPLQTTVSEEGRSSEVEF